MTEPMLHVVAGLGPVGRAVVAELVGRGLPVRAIARHPVAGLPREVAFVQADISDPDAARHATAGAAVVYHAASAPYDRWPALLPPLMRGVLLVLRVPSPVPRWSTRARWSGLPRRRSISWPTAAGERSREIRSAAGARSRGGTRWPSGPRRSIRSELS